MLRHDYAIRHHEIDIYLYLQGIGLDLEVDRGYFLVKKYRKIEDRRYG